MREFYTEEEISHVKDILEFTDEGSEKKKVINKVLNDMVSRDDVIIITNRTIKDLWESTKPFAWDRSKDGSIMEEFLDPKYPDYVRVASISLGVVYIKESVMINSLKEESPSEWEEAWTDYIDSGNGVILEGMCEQVMSVIERIDDVIRWEELYVNSIDWCVANFDKLHDTRALCEDMCIEGLQILEEVNESFRDGRQYTTHFLVRGEKVCINDVQVIMERD